MNCGYEVKASIYCKFKGIKQLPNSSINYCSRHFNKLSKLQNETEKNDEIKLEKINIDSINEIILYKDNKNEFILKYQNITNIKNVLHFEYKILTEIFKDHENIIKFYEYSNEKKSTDDSNECNATIKYEYLPISYDDLKNNYNLNENDIKNIGIQLIKVIKFIHLKKYLYLKIDPNNIRFCYNNTGKLVVKLINFESCIQYLNNNSEFYPNYVMLERSGSDTYSSRNINLSNRGVRYDDIENILYILLDLLNVPEFEKLKRLKQMKRIINKKNSILKEKTNFDFINNYINILNDKILFEDLNIHLQNKPVNYNLFINTLK
jgi:serine/threonine protein kinase